MSDFNYEKAKGIARQIAQRDQCDIFLYNGGIERKSDLNLIEMIDSHKRSTRVRLMMVTPGGDPDAAYKIARYLQDRYETFEFIVSGYCKSAGTLVAMGAHELIFAPYGELGPLDVQVQREDKLSGLHSGLNISEAMQALEGRTFDTYMRFVSGLLQSSQGVVSFATAAKSASDVVTSLYQPIFAQFDPEEIGSRTRSMRIAADYGQRLNSLSNNAKADATRKLAETYPSHGFVIDRAEARALFNRVRDADPLEMELVISLGDCSRYPVNGGPLMDPLSFNGEEANESSAEVGDSGAGAAAGGDSVGTGQSPGAVAEDELTVQDNRRSDRDGDDAAA